MSSIADGAPVHDPSPPNGWLPQLLTALWRAVFDDRWAPWIRLMITVIVGVSLYVGLRVLG